MNDKIKDSHYSTEGRANTQALASKAVDKLVLTAAGFDAKLNAEGNAAYRHGLRITIAVLADELDKRGYLINRVVFDKLMESVDNVYYNEDERKKGLQVNIRFDWQDIGSYAANVEALTRKKIKNVLSVRLAIFYKGIHAYDIDGNFATSKMK